MNSASGLFGDGATIRACLFEIPTLAACQVVAPSIDRWMPSSRVAT
jgi:hypothetical protein